MRKAPTSRFASVTTAVIAALLLSVFAFGGQAGAWVTPTLTANCAPDTGHYAWTINLHPEQDQNIEMMWGSGAVFQTTNFGTSGTHTFTTGRGGATLVVRYASDRNVKTSAAANGTLCGTGTTGGTVAGSQQNNSDKNTSKQMCASASTNETGNHDGDHQHEDTNSGKSCGTGTTAGGDNNGGNSNGGTQTCTGVAKIVSHSDIGFTQGGVASVSFTMGKGCTGQELSLVSYTAPSDTFTRESASQQRIFQAKTGIFGDMAGAHTYVLSVNVPSCFFQIDFVTGQPIAQFGPAESNNFYSDQGRLLAGVNGGTMSCTTSNSNGANETTQTVTPTSAFVGSPTDTSANGSETPSTGSTPNGNAVAGFQTAPNGVGFVTPIVDVPGGSNQQAPSVAPTTMQNGTVAGVQTLPSTSTSTPAIPLAAMGLAIMALGGLLLRRPDAQR